jgi:serine/threonine protein kinase
LDGSENPWFPVGVLPGASKIFYHHIPTQNSNDQKENYLLRIKFSTKLSKTKYSALCADDDVFLIGGLVEAIRLLESKDEIDSITGKSCEYLKTDLSVLWFEVSRHVRDTERYHSEISRRLFSEVLIANYYGIFRTQVWKQIHESQTSYSFKAIVCNEFLAHFLVSALCRNFVIDSYLWARNQGHPNPSGISDNQVRFGDWVNSQNHTEEVKVFSTILSESLSTIDSSLNRENADKLVGLMLSRIPRHRPTCKQIFERRAKALILIWISCLPKTVRRGLYAQLSHGLQKRVGSDDFDVNFKPKNFLSEELSCTEDFQNFEKLLLVPREELRLRANI